MSPSIGICNISADGSSIDFCYYQQHFQPFQDLLVRIRKGGSDRESYEMTIDTITFADNIAIVMNNETIKPTGIATNAGITVKRRYTMSG